MSYLSKDDLQLDPKLKTAEWASKKITRFRNSWRWLVNPIYYNRMMATILSEQTMDEVKKKFKDWESIDKDFLQLAILEKARTILKAERNKAGLKITLDATDPSDTSAPKEKEDDKTLLKNRKGIEQTITALMQEIGGPKYSLANEKKENGKPIFNGNMEGFDKLGLDDRDDLDIDYFMQTHYKFRHEIAGNELLQHVIKSNKVQTFIDYWCNDIMAVKAIAMRMFVDEITGKPSLKYINPSQVRIIPGKMKDGTDAQCIGYEEKGSVGQFLKLVGKEFTWHTEIQYLIGAINSANGTLYTGVFDRDTLFGTDLGNVCTYGQFVAFDIAWGYIEWKEIDVDAYKAGVDYHGNERMIAIKPDATVTERSRYAKEEYYNEVVYKAIYLGESSGDQRLYKYGPLFHQSVEGTEDELANFSVIIRKEEGPTIAKIARPFVDFANTLFYRFKQLTFDAKKAGRSYDIWSLREAAKAIHGDGLNAATFKEFLKETKESPDMFHVPPTDSNGRSVGGGGNPNFVVPNGLDPMATVFQQIVDWCQQKIMDNLGINALREGSSPDPKDGVKLGLQALAQSRNATDYMSEMILSVLSQSGYMTLWITQDIIRYKGSIAYDYLKRSLGEDVLDNLNEMGGFAFHRYGIFINTFNNDIEIAELKQDARQAFFNKEIDFGTYEVLKGIDDPKKGAYELAYAKARKEKKDQQAAQQLQQNAIQLDNVKTDNELKVVDRKGEWDFKVEQERSRGILASYQAQANADVQKEILRQQNEPNKQNAKAAAAITVKQEEAALQQQKV